MRMHARYKHVDEDEKAAEAFWLECGKEYGLLQVQDDSRHSCRDKAALVWLYLNHFNGGAFLVFVVGSALACLVIWTHCGSPGGVMEICCVDFWFDVGTDVAEGTRACSCKRSTLYNGLEGVWCKCSHCTLVQTGSLCYHLDLDSACHPPGMHPCGTPAQGCTTVAEYINHNLTTVQSPTKYAE